MDNEQKKVIWTRAVADWAKDEPVLSSIMPHLLRLPSIMIGPIEAKAPAPTDYFVFTSANAARFCFQIPEVAKAIKEAKICFTHGKQTSIELEALGANAAYINSAKTAEELSAHLIKLIPEGATVTVPRPKKVAFDIASDLSKVGINAESFVCYETKTGVWTSNLQALEDREIEEVKETLSGVICFSSISSVKGFASVFSPSTNRLREALTVVAIGPTTADAAKKHFAKVIVSDESTIPRLVNAVEKVVAEEF